MTSPAECLMMTKAVKNSLAGITHVPDEERADFLKQLYSTLDAAAVVDGHIQIMDDEDREDSRELAAALEDLYSVVASLVVWLDPPAGLREAA